MTTSLDMMHAGLPRFGTLGPAGIQSVAGVFVKPQQNLPAAGAGWTSQTFTASGNFTAPAGPVDKDGYVEVYVTGTGGGASGGQTSHATSETDLAGAAGGSAGDWVRRYKVRLRPLEVVAVTVASTATAASGAASSFGSYLTLSGGTKGGNGVIAASTNIVASTAGYTGSTTGTVNSGLNSTDNAVRKGARGGRSGVYSPTTGNGSPDRCAAPGDSNPTMGAYIGGTSPIEDPNFSPYGGISGGGGAGLFGNGGNGSASSGSAAAANSGGGGGGGGWGGSPGLGGDGAAGQWLVEWRVAA